MARFFVTFPINVNHLFKFAAESDVYHVIISCWIKTVLSYKAPRCMADETNQAISDEIEQEKEHFQSVVNAFLYYK